MRKFNECDKETAVKINKAKKAAKKNHYSKKFINRLMNAKSIVEVCEISEGRNSKKLSYEDIIIKNYEDVALEV